MTPRIFLRVTAPALLVGLVLVGLSVGSAWSIHRLQRNLSYILRSNVASIQASLDLQNSLRKLRHQSLLYLVHPTPDVMAGADEGESEFREALQRARDCAETPQERACVARIEAGFRQYEEEMARLRSRVAVQGPSSLKEFAELALTHPIHHITEPCQEFGDINRRHFERIARDSAELSERWRVVLWLAGLAAPLGGLIVGYGIARGLTRSIARLRLRIQDVADRLPLPESNGGIQLTLRADGDLGGVESQLDEVVRRVEEVVGRLQQQQREMLRAEQLAAVGQLAAGVAHEVRNPLTGMKLLVEAALRPARPRPLSEEDLRVIHGEIARLEGIVQHFLDFARPQPLRREQRDLREVVARPVELVRGRARQQGVEVEVSLPDGPLTVSLDEGQFASVVLNVLLNALDAMPRGGRARLGAEAAGGVARLLVEDTGPGIAPELLPRLFTPFATTRATGTGLGLSLSKRVVEEHGGRISAANGERGACFVIELPLCGAPAGR